MNKTYLIHAQVPIWLNKLHNQENPRNQKKLEKSICVSWILRWSMINFNFKWSTINFNFKRSTANSLRELFVADFPEKEKHLTLCLKSPLWKQTTKLKTNYLTKKKIGQMQIALMCGVLLSEGRFIGVLL